MKAGTPAGDAGTDRTCILLPSLLRFPALHDDGHDVRVPREAGDAGCGPFASLLPSLPRLPALRDVPASLQAKKRACRAGPDYRWLGRVSERNVIVKIRRGRPGR